MALKLNQVIAIVSGKKTAASKTITDLHHQLQTQELVSGIARVYRPKDEDGEHFPPERKNVQLRFRDVKETIAQALTEMMDIVATQDDANTKARADVVVDGKPVLKNLPVTTLIFLEKQLVDVHTFVDKFPTLDPAETWKMNTDADCYSSEPSQTNKTKKVPMSKVLYEATPEHPAQVHTYTEDVVVGQWTTTKFSGALPAKDKNDILRRIVKLQDAVKAAREEANSQNVENQQVGKDLFAYIFS